MQERNARPGLFSGRKGFAPHRGTDDSFDRSMVLFDHLLEGWHVADGDRRAVYRVVRSNGRGSGLTAITGDGFGVPGRRMALVRTRVAACSSRGLVRRKLKVCPVLSTAR